MNLINAIDFINKTKVEVTTPAEPEVQEIVVKEGRPTWQKVLLVSGIVLLCLLGAGALYVAIVEVIQLFF